MKYILNFLFVSIFVMQLQAQQKTISGIITDETGIPLPGVTIVEKGTTNGTQTNFEGKYTINATAGNILLFSFIGYVREERTVGEYSTISFSMQPDKSSLDEVVVMAYSNKSRRRTKPTSAAQLVANKNNVVRTLQGSVSGVKIKKATKTRINKENSSIVLRGNTSTNGKIEPLVIIDGKPSTQEDLRKLKAKKVKEIKILKDAGATAIYGNRGANGVILVSTKKGNFTMPDVHKIANESYTKIHENKFKLTNTSALSTFSIDVDKASYSNVRRMINNAQHIPADAVKIEEMINYFNYNYSQPKDEHPFAIHTEVAQTPWNNQTKLVKIGLQGKTYENKELPAANLTFLIDVSGSMSHELKLLKSAFKLLVDQLRDKDKVSIVVYAGAAGVVLEPTSGKDKKKILKALNKLQSGGSTAGGAGINLAYKLAEENFNKNGNNRVILATDGDFNVGASSNQAMEDLIVEKRKSGVFLSVLGFGYGNYKDDKLETLADKGNGNHAYIDTMQEAKLIFGKEFGGTLFTIAKDVKIQVEFNPTKVQAYRLIGYENRLLANEDFIDDTKDAGELGSGHKVTALYEVIPVGVESKYIKGETQLKYTKTVEQKQYSNELLTVKFRYKKPDEDTSIEMVHVATDKTTEASVDMKFASAVALFGMQLRESQFDNNSNLDTVIKLAKQGRGEDEDGYRAEFIRLVKSSQSI